MDANAVEGLAIFGTSQADGQWQYSLDGGGTWTDIGTVSLTDALLLGENDRVRFVPDTDTATAGWIDVRAWDQTVGTAGSTGDASLGGGSLAFSPGTERVVLTVTEVNDAPVIDLELMTALEQMAMTTTLPLPLVIAQLH